jgi:hypothetical protein
MLYLARVQAKHPDNAHGEVPALRLLAYQEGEHAWQLIEDEHWVDLNLDLNPPQDYSQQLGAWFLVEVTSEDMVTTMQDATAWLTRIIQTYLSKGIKPEFFAEETERIERWRQNLTIQSQDIGRRALELEARLHQIQELEERLEVEKAELDNLKQQLM